MFSTTASLRHMLRSGTLASASANEPFVRSFTWRQKCRCFAWKHDRLVESIESPFLERMNIDIVETTRQDCMKRRQNLFFCILPWLSFKDKTHYDNIEWPKGILSILYNTIYISAHIQILHDCHALDQSLVSMLQRERSIYKWYKYMPWFSTRFITKFDCQRVQ